MRLAVVPVRKIRIPDVAVTLGVLLAALYFALVSLAAIPPLRCPWRVLLGVECPMCGTTRALLALCRGEVIAALAWNPFAILLAIAAVAVAVNEITGAVLRRRLSLQLGAKEGRVLLAAFFAALAANWAWVLLR
jgi:hypothetical protein